LAPWITFHQYPPNNQHNRSDHLPRKPNYDFEKRRKEQDRAAKKEAKREERQRRKDEGQPDQPDESTGTDQSPTTHHA